MNKLSVKSENKITNKKSRKFCGILRHLAKSDTSIFNTMKITVYKDDITKENNHIFIAPSMFIDFQEHWMNHISTENTSENIIKNLNKNSIIENEIPSPQNTELKDYPDSSDFDDDDE